MLVCWHPGLLFLVHPAGLNRKIALISIYLTWLLSSLHRCTSCVYFFGNVDATIMNLTYFNPHNLQLAPLNLVLTAVSSFLSCVWDELTGGVVQWQFQWTLNFFLFFFAIFTHLLFIFLLHARLALVTAIQFSCCN